MSKWREKQKLLTVTRTVFELFLFIHHTCAASDCTRQGTLEKKRTSRKQSSESEKKTHINDSWAVSHHLNSAPMNIRQKHFMKNWWQKKPEIKFREAWNSLIVFWRLFACVHVKKNCRYRRGVRVEQPSTSCDFPSCFVFSFRRDTFLRQPSVEKHLRGCWPASDRENENSTTKWKTSDCDWYNGIMDSVVVRCTLMSMRK